MAKQEIYVGIDVAFAKKKRLPVCICQRTNTGIEPLPLNINSTFPPPPSGKGNRAALDATVRASFAQQVVQWLEKLAKDNDFEIKRIAIDAPRMYAIGKRRSAERAMDERGISCFATPTKEDFIRKISEADEHLKSGGKEARMPNANQLWMLIGFSLFDALSAYDCIEVFPQAIVRELGCGKGHKSSSTGFDEQVEKFAAALGKSTTELRVYLKTLGFGGRHDRLDAFMSAWVASLPENERTPYGTPPNDAIWVPKVGLPAYLIN